LALSVFSQSQVFQNFRSGSFVVLIGKVHFFQRAFWLVVAFGYSAFWQGLFLPLLKNKLCVKVGRVGGGFFFQQRFGKRAGYPTKRAPDAGDSGENLKHFSTPQHFSSWTASPSPAPARVTQTVGLLFA